MTRCLLSVPFPGPWSSENLWRNRLTSSQRKHPSSILLDSLMLSTCGPLVQLTIMTPQQVLHPLVQHQILATRGQSPSPPVHRWDQDTENHHQGPAEPRPPRTERPELDSGIWGVWNSYVVWGSLANPLIDYVLLTLISAVVMSLVVFVQQRLDCCVFIWPINLIGHHHCNNQQEQSMTPDQCLPPVCFFIDSFYFCSWRQQSNPEPEPENQNPGAETVEHTGHTLTLATRSVWMITNQYLNIESSCQDSTSHWRSVDCVATSTADRSGHNIGNVSLQSTIIL